MSLGQLIKTYRDRHNLSLRDLADKTGLSHGYLDQLEKGRDPRTGKTPKPTIETMKALAAGMGMSLKELLIMTGNLEAEAETDRPQIATQAAHREDGYDEELSPEDKRMLEELKEYLRQKYRKNK